MLRALLEAIANGARRAFGVVSGIVMWPFTLFGGGGGRSRPGPDMSAVKAAEQSVDAARAKDSNVVQSTLRDSEKRDAQIAWSWITTSLLTRQSMPFPSAMSIRMKSWLQGLDHAQLECLQKAGAVGISAHVAGKQITGVASVKPMAPVMLKFPKIQKSDAEISDFAISLSR